MSRFGLLASGLLFATALLAHGCASDDAEVTPPVVVEPLAPVDFASVSEDERVAAILAVLDSGEALRERILTSASFDIEGSSPCPLVVETDGASEYQGGCTTLGGASYEGRFAGPLDGSGELVFHDFEFAGHGIALALDGSVTRTGLAPTITTRLDLTSDLRAPVRVVQELACTAGSCEAASGAHGELVDVGSFTHVVRTELSDGVIVGGVVELRGENTLRVDLVADDNGCWSYTIDGTAAGRVCGYRRGTRAAPSTNDAGVNLECLGICVIAFLLPGEAVAVSVRALPPEGELTLELEPAGLVQSSFGELVPSWAAPIELEDPILYNDDRHELFTVQYADGSTACLANGDPAVFADAPSDCVRLF